MTRELIPDNPNPHKIKITFQNINGWIGKQHALKEIYTQANPDIILFAHTNIQSPTAPIKIHPYITYMHNTARIGSGVAILIKPHITHSKISHTFLGETLAIQVETSLGPIIIATHYSPPARRYIPIADLNWLARHQTPVYLLGDLNARHTSYCTTTNNYGTVLHNEFLRHGRLQRIGPPAGTFRSNRGTLTKPDIALTNTHCYHYTHCSNLPFNVSDHAPFCLEISARAIRIPCPEFELNAKADWTQFENLLKSKIPPMNLNLKVCQ